MSGFSASWRSVRTRSEAGGDIGPALALYGLRHTVAGVMREIGRDARTIADAIGRKTIETVRPRAKGEDLHSETRCMVASFDVEPKEHGMGVVESARQDCQTRRNRIRASGRSR